MQTSPSKRVSFHKPIITNLSFIYWMLGEVKIDDASAVCKFQKKSALFQTDRQTETATMGAPAVAGGGFQFITSINTIVRDDETRRKVRSHARRQKLPTTQVGEAPVKSTTVTTQKERTGKFRLGGGGDGGSSGKTGSGGARVTSNRKKRSSAAAVANMVPATGSSSPGDEAPDQPDGGDKWESSMITRELALTVGVAKELPNFSALSIETTPLTEALLRYMMTVCLSPKETSVQKWFDRAGAPTYMTTRKAERTKITTTTTTALIPRLPLLHTVSFLFLFRYPVPGGCWR